MKLLIHPAALARIAARLTGPLATVEPVGAEAAAEIEAAWLSADLFESDESGAFIRAALGAPGLRWAHTAAAGVDHPLFGAVVAKGARLTTSHGQAVGMADYVLAGVLDVFQRGPERRAAQAERRWERFRFREVLDSQWLIVGFGAVGQGVARRARGFGARITAVRRSPQAHADADIVLSPDRIGEALSDADVVVLCPPLGPATRHMVDADFLAAMKDGSVLANVGRGALIDEAALVAALDRGVPAHAVLDVFETEPLPADSPLWTHPRVALTAHASGETGAQNRRNDETFLDNLRRYLAGETLLGEADPRDVGAGGPGGA